jgi:tRNA A-37 threonylcarbamoyl transferase component Bud32
MRHDAALIVPCEHLGARVLACATVLGRVLAQKYRLVAEIGAGAMGRVYRARQLDLARDVAIKVLHPMMAEDEDAQLRFAREAKVAARLNHPAAVSVLDYGIDDGLAYLVMELMEGETLRDRISRMPLTRHDALAVASDVADALIAAHQIRLIHRDIKPENTFLQRTSSGERVRVVDFGLAFLATEEVALGRMTQDGFVGGTPAYMSPEQVHGRGVGPAADIYGLGCMLYELIAGHPPFRGSLAELLTSQAYAPARPMRLLSLSPPISPELDRLVMAMLSKSAPLRPSPGVVWQALHDLAADLPTRATATSYVSARSARALGRIAPPVTGTGAPMISIAQGSRHAAIKGRDDGEQPTLPSDAAMQVGAHLLGRAEGTGDADPSRDATIGASSKETLDALPRPLVRVLSLGELSDDLELGLIAAGCEVGREEPGSVSAAMLDGTDVIWAPGATDARVTELARHAPVVTDLLMEAPASTASPTAPSPTASIDGLLLRLRAGAADLVIDEVTPDQLARKLIRAARRPKVATATVEDEKIAP